MKWSEPSFLLICLSTRVCLDETASMLMDVARSSKTALQFLESLGECFHCFPKSVRHSAPVCMRRASVVHTSLSICFLFRGRGFQTCFVWWQLGHFVQRWKWTRRILRESGGRNTRRQWMLAGPRKQPWPHRQRSMWKLCEDTRFTQARNTGTVSSRVRQGIGQAKMFCNKILEHMSAEGKQYAPKHEWGGGANGCTAWVLFWLPCSSLSSFPCDQTGC